MSQSYKELIQQLNPPLSTLRKEAAETMSGFDSMSKAAMSAGVLSALDKELIAAAIAVSTRCEGCIAYHCLRRVQAGVIILRRAADISPPACPALRLLPLATPH